MSAGDEMDPRLRSAFGALREESAARPDGGATEAARAAMHQARALQPQPGGLALFGRRLRAGLAPRLLLTTGGTLAAGLAAVGVIGWNAPAGTPLHGIRVAHESLQRSLPGADRVGLDLDYAESRMADAQQSSGSWASSLDEAARYLDDARQNMSLGSGQWPRWEGDEALLASLRRHDGGDQGPKPGGPGETESESSTQSGGASSEGGDDRNTSGSTSSGTVEEHESSSSSSSSVEEHSSSSSSSSSSSGDGGGGGSTSSTSSRSTSSSSDGGGSGGGSDG